MCHHHEEFTQHAQSRPPDRKRGAFVSVWTIQGQTTQRESPSVGGQVSTQTDEWEGDWVSKQLHAHLPVIHEPRDGGSLAESLLEASQTAVMSDFMFAPYLEMCHMTSVNV